MTNSQNIEAMLVHASQAAQLLKTLSNEYRLLIVCTLIDGECSVSELQELMPLSQSALSQHLAVLRKAGLVATRRESQSIFYRVTGNQAIQLIQTLQRIYCPPEEG